MKQDLDQINMLSTFHLILGILTCFASSLTFGHISGGIMMLNIPPDAKGSPPPPIIGWLFIIAGLVGFAIIMSVGIVMIIASRRLKAHQSRMFCLVVAGIECAMAPLGTVLGVFTIITLIKDSVIQLFEGETLPNPQLKPEQPGPGI